MGTGIRRKSKIREKVRGLVPWNGYEDSEYNAYLDELNPRENQIVRRALASAGDNRFVRFLELMSDPRQPRSTLSALAKKVGITLDEFQKWYRSVTTQRAIAIFQERAPRIAEHTADDAESRDAGCDRCDGLGWIGAQSGIDPAPAGYRLMGTSSEGMEIWVRSCPQCSGTAKIRIPGDRYARDQVFHGAGVITKEPGFRIVQNFGGVGSASSVPALSPMTIDVSADE
jgi:hypothetical protein